MANEKKSIIEEALLEAEQIDAAFKSNAKEILSQTMSSEIEEMVKESLTGSKKRLKEEDEEEEMDLDLELDTEEGEEEGEESEEMDLDMDTEEGEESEDMDLDMDMDTEDMDMDLDLGDESEEGSEMDLDMDMENEPSGEEMETVDLTNVSDDSKLISVFKKMGPEDEIEVVNDNGMVTLKDNKSGSEYRIELNSTGGVSNVESSEIELGEGTEESGEIIYEIVVDDKDEMSDYMMDYASDEDEMMDHMDHMDYASDEDEMSYMTKKGLHYTEKYNNNPKLKGGQKTKLPDELQRGIVGSENDEDDEDEMSYMDYASDYAEDEDYMARRKTTKGRYATGNRTNINAINRMGGAESYKSTYGMSESKTPQITKLIKENTNLNTKNSTLETENAELKDTQEKMVEALKQFRKKLQEVAVFNSNLTYAVRLFTENSTTKEEKQEILKRLDSAKDLKESQSIYKQLVKEYTNGKTPIKESIEEKINKTASSGAQISEQSVFVHPELQNMKKLWEYSYKK